MRARPSSMKDQLESTIRLRTLSCVYIHDLRAENDVQKHTDDRKEAETENEREQETRERQETARVREERE